ncbi:MAG: signal recognition particle-docking protein FtsY [Pirellulaceae bacterium]|nr:signal recognition particle-docking protein FtsY [Planctomycetales bacterium]
MGLFDRFKKKDQPDPTAAQSTDNIRPDATGTRTASDADVLSADLAGDYAASEHAHPATPVANASSGGGFFASLRNGLRKTAAVLNTDIRDLFRQDGQLLDDQFVDRLFALLVRTDMGAAPAREICEDIRGKFRGRRVEMREILQIVRERLNALISQEEQPVNLASDGPTVIMVVGVNGAGKTTSIAKLAARFVGEGKQVVVGAGDTFRAAAVEQLSVWADRIGAEIVKGEQGGDPASVAHRAVAKALELNAEVCIVDTAGRLQTQVNLMEQLAKIRRVMCKLIPDAPHEVLLVLDATAGQNGISQARGFSDAVQCTGIVLAKLDGTAKGGVIIPIRQQFDLPVKFIGVGEKVTDLAPFDSQQFVQALFADMAS